MRGNTRTLTYVFLLALGTLLLGLSPREGVETAPQKRLHLRVVSGAPPGAAALTISPSTIPNGKYGSAYVQTLKATGGQGKTTFTVTSGALPPGISLSTDGGLSGTPTKAGNYSFTVTAVADGVKNTPPPPPPPPNGPDNGDDKGDGKGKGDGKDKGDGDGKDKGKGKGDKDNESSVTADGAGALTASQAYTLVIEPAALTVTANNITTTYGHAVPALTVAYSGFVNGDNASKLKAQPGASTAATSASPAGAYPISVSGGADENYTFTYNSGKLVINPAPLAITANAQKKGAGDPDPTLTFTASGFVNGDNMGVLTGNLSRTPGENVGVYPINKGTLSAGTNYAISFTGSTLTITIGSQHITWSQNLFIGCSSTTKLQLNATASSGLPVSYTVADPTVASVSGSVLTFLRPGTTIITASQAGDANHSAAPPISDTVSYQPASLVRQHWADVLFFDNSSGDYVQWQWYKDGQAVPNATDPYYSETPSLNGQYYVIATNTSGQQIQSCILTIAGGKETTGGIKVNPNPINAGASVTVIADYTATALIGAVLQVIDLGGKVRQQLSAVEPSMQVTMPSESGIYIINLLLTNGQKASINVLVHA